MFHADTSLRIFRARRSCSRVIFGLLHEANDTRVFSSAVAMFAPLVLAFEAHSGVTALRAEDGDCVP